MVEAYEDISRERAKELVDEADKGILVVLNAEPVPAIGDVPDEDREKRIVSGGYRFGEEVE